MTANPFNIPLPNSFALGDLNAAMNGLIKHLAWDLGERYDQDLSKFDDEWLRKICQARGDNYALHDPGFVFGEPEFHPNSPVWHSLGGFSIHRKKLLFRCRKTRNAWEHDAVSQDKGTFKQGVQRVHEAAEEFGSVSTSDACIALFERFNELQAAGGELPGNKDAVAELEAMAEDARREADEREAELQRARRERDQQGQANEQLAGRIGELEELLDSARRREESLRDQKFVELQQRRLLEPAASLQPGQDWEGPLPTRTLSLNPFMIDLLDANRGVMLSDELGPVAKEASGRWLQVMPQGGEVHLTDGGNAAGKIGGRFVYLGRLDQDLAEVSPEDLAAATTYEKGADGVLVDVETGEAAHDMTIEALRTVKRGSRVRVTPGRRAIAYDGGQLRDLGFAQLGSQDGESSW